METDISNIYNVSEHDRLLKASEVALQLNISLSLTYRLMQKGEIPNIRIASCVRVHLSDLEDYVRKNRSS